MSSISPKPYSPPVQRQVQQQQERSVEVKDKKRIPNSRLSNQSVIKICTFIHDCFRNKDFSSLNLDTLKNTFKSLDFDSKILSDDKYIINLTHISENISQSKSVYELTHELDILNFLIGTAYNDLNGAEKIALEKVRSIISQLQYCPESINREKYDLEEDLDRTFEELRECLGERNGQNNNNDQLCRYTQNSTRKKKHTPTKYEQYKQDIALLPPQKLSDQIKALCNFLDENLNLPNLDNFNSIDYQVLKNKTKDSFICFQITISIITQISSLK